MQLSYYPQYILKSFYIIKQAVAILKIGVPLSRLSIEQIVLG